MLDSKIGYRYAKALARFITSDTTAVADALDTVAQLFSIPESKKILCSPVMPAALKVELIDFALEKSKADAGVKQFILQVVESGRTSVIPEIAASFHHLIDTAAGRVQATVTTAIALAPADVAEIASSLGAALKKKVMLTTAVDPSILGGFVVHIGNSVVDLSLKSKIDAIAHSAVQ